MSTNSTDKLKLILSLQKNCQESQKKGRQERIEMLLMNDDVNDVLNTVSQLLRSK